MNSNTSEEFHTILRELPSAPSNSTAENPRQSVSQSAHMTQPLIQLPIIQTGATESNQILIPSEPVSPPKNGTNSVNPSQSLKSHVKPHVLLESPPEIRVLKVNKEDLEALAQVIAEFQEQIMGF